MRVPAKTLKPYLDVAAAIAPTRLGSSYACALLRNRDGQQEIVASDTTTMFVATIPEASDPVNIAANAKFLANLVGVHGDVVLEFSEVGEKVPQLAVSEMGAKRSSTLKAIAADDFPAVAVPVAFEEAGYKLFITASGAELDNYITRLKTTAAKDDFEYVTFTGDIVQSYNRYSFTYKDVKLLPTVLRIPVSTFVLLKRLLQSTDTVQIYHSEHEVAFVGPNYTLKTELGSGGFLDVSRFQVGDNMLVTVAAADLQKLAKVIKSSSGYLRIDIKPDGVEATFFAPNESVPAYRVTFPHTTPPAKVKPFTVTATMPVLAPIVNGLGKDHVAFGVRITPEKGTVGLIVSDGYAQIFAQAAIPAPKAQEPA